jgi:hypothetical protein
VSPFLLLHLSPLPLTLPLTTSTTTSTINRYEIFFNSHHFFCVFYFVMFLHGPVFFYWTCAPVLLYVVERYMQTFRGNRSYSVIKVDWIPPVMGVYFRPKDKADMRFKEGQYLYLSCPFM